MNKQRFLRNLGCFLLAGAICAPLAGCGPHAPDDNEPYSPPEEWHEDSIDYITLFHNDWDQFNNGAQANSPVYRELKKAAGCDLRARSTAFETYYTQLDLQRVNQELDEMFCIDGPVAPELYRGLIRDEEIIPISYYVNENTKEQYPNLFNYLKDYEYMKSNVSYAKGELWFVPCRLYNDKSLYVRRDWIRNLNAKIDDILVADGVVENASAINEELRAEYRFSEEGPKDLGEFYRLARAFTIHDPDNNGQKDTYGYVTEENRDMDSWMHVAFDNPWKMWVDGGDGVYANTATSEGSMLATSLLNKLVSEGYTSREFGAKDFGNKQTDFAQGMAGMMYAHNWYNVISAEMMGSHQASGIADARDKILICDPPAGKNGLFGGQGDKTYYRGWCIREGLSVERREACLRLLDFLYSQEGLELVNWGVQGEHWEWKDDVVGGDRVSMLEKDSNGFLQALRWTDYSAFAVYLCYEPTDAFRLMTNGDILVDRNEKSAATMILSDYPDLYTDAMIRYQTGAYDFFDTTVIRMAVNKNLAANWTFDAKTWKTDWKTKLYSVSETMQSEWNNFVNDYNNVYFGSRMQTEYNEAIASGNFVKIEK